MNEVFWCRAICLSIFLIIKGKLNETFNQNLNFEFDIETEGEGKFALKNKTKYWELLEDVFFVENIYNNEEKNDIALNPSDSLLTMKSENTSQNEDLLDLVSLFGF